MFQQLYAHNSDIILDKDKSEHYAAGSVLVERALLGIQAAIAELTSMSASEFQDSWSACTSPVQQAGRHAADTDGPSCFAEAFYTYLALSTSRCHAWKYKRHSICCCLPSCLAGLSHPSLAGCQQLLHHSSASAKPLGQVLCFAFREQHSTAPVLGEYCDRLVNTVPTKQQACSRCVHAVLAPLTTQGVNEVLIKLSR